MGVRLVECGAGHLDAVVECGRIRRECRTGPEGERNAGEHRGCRDPGDGTRPYHRPMDLAAELRGLPKAELHQHIDGAVRPATAVELAAEAGIALAGVAEARRRLVAPTHCRDQAELLSYFDLPIALLQTTAALTRVSAELVADLAADGVRYAELRWAPRLHLEAGLSVDEVIGAVADGVAQAGGGAEGRAPLIGLIVTAMRSHPPAANVRLAEAAASFGAPVVGFDLAGPEAAYPASPHAAAFLAAERGGLATTAHAGEVRGPQRIVEALDLGVRRIAHGVTAAKDDDVMAIVRARDVTLDLCPTSNVQAGIVADLAAHPLAALHRAGISVTISTDDRTVSDVTLTEELARASRVIGITDAELAAISTNAFRRAFAPRDVMAPAPRCRRAGVGRLAGGPHQLTPIPSAVGRSAGPARTRSGRRSPSRVAAAAASATPVSTSTAAIPARRAATTSASGLSPMTTASSAAHPTASRIAVNIAGEGFPITVASRPLAIETAATTAPAPGRKPPGVG